MNFEKIYNEYKNKILKYTLSYTKNRDDVEELTQQIFYNIFVGLKNFKKKSSLNTFIYAIARNTCLTFLKKTIRDREKMQKAIRLYEVKYEDNPLDNIVVSEQIKYFMMVLDKLKEENREVFYLFEVENLKYTEISEILKLPVGTVKSRLHRAKERIVELLSDDNEKEG